jgi:AcrR family transcriptional regulator
VATQEQRKAETRRRLLDAAAELFASRGIEAVSVDTIAAAADRTSGAVYAHFGGKEGLLLALLEEWTDATAVVVAAELELTTTVDEQLEAIWRNLVAPPTDDARRWVLLEHELWLYAARHPEARQRLAARYQRIRERLSPAFGAPEALLALLLGLEMQHRLDPGSMPDDVALAALRSFARTRTGTRRRGR